MDRGLRDGRSTPWAKMHMSGAGGIDRDELPEHQPVTGSTKLGCCG